MTGSKWILWVIQLAAGLLVILAATSNPIAAALYMVACAVAAGALHLARTISATGEES